MSRHPLLLLVLLITTPMARGQIRVPALPVPGLPTGAVGVPRVDPTLTSAVGQTGAVLQDVRRQAAALIRANRAVLEADADGYAIVRGEVLMYSPSEAQLSAAQTAGYSIIRTRDLPALNARLVVLSVPARVGTRRALARLRTLIPATALDFNHVYLRSGAEDPAGNAAPQAVPAQAATAVDSNSTRVGLIDGGVDVHHPVFKDVSIHRYGCGGAQIIDGHGTAVASLLVGRSAQFHGAAAGAELDAVDVYCGAPTGGSVDAIADAFEWLATERVAVINVSLVGPANVALGAIVQSMLQHGHLIVAAVGNDGPSAPPLYPASYPGVVGVTAVDKDRHALVEAAHGSQVKFAAPGADMTAAKSPQGFALVRGTSFAAPIVAGLLSHLLPAPDTQAASAAVMQLAQSAIDLGSPGPDSVYGYGLVGEQVRPEPGLARL